MNMKRVFYNNHMKRMSYDDFSYDDEVDFYVNSNGKFEYSHTAKHKDSLSTIKDRVREKKMSEDEAISMIYILTSKKRNCKIIGISLLESKPYVNPSSEGSWLSLTFLKAGEQKRHRRSIVFAKKIHNALRGNVSVKATSSKPSVKEKEHGEAITLMCSFVENCYADKIMLNKY